MKKLIHQYIEKLIPFLKRKITDLEAIYLYGSFVSGDNTSSSDLDIAIKSDSKIDKVSRWEIQQELSSFLGRDVDLLDLNEASLVMKFEVLTTAKRVFCSDLEKTESFETLIYSMYLDFAEIRKPIVEAILQRGSVYGNR